MYSAFLCDNVYREQRHVRTLTTTVPNSMAASTAWFVSTSSSTSDKKFANTERPSRGSSFLSSACICSTSLLSFCSLCSRIRRFARRCSSPTRRDATASNNELDFEVFLVELCPSGPRELGSTFAPNSEGRFDRMVGVAEPGVVATWRAEQSSKSTSPCSRPHEVVPERPNMRKIKAMFAHADRCLRSLSIILGVRQSVTTFHHTVSEHPQEENSADRQAERWKLCGRTRAKLV
mmetsp:Transcript_88702/g.185432  ORF Transcript_88702/g.185432 Transcript_88702/m.185432 type:complete len:234 (+) Transcript_88702:333-1034(+)